MLFDIPPLYVFLPVGYIQWHCCPGLLDICTNTIPFEDSFVQIQFFLKIISF